MKELGAVSKNVVRFLLNLLTRNLLIAVMVYCCWIPIMYYNYWFSWHVILCTVGMIPLMSEGLMLFPKDELWSTQVGRQKKHLIHGVLFLLGTILVSVGSILTFIYLEDHYHLYTIHGITGLIAMILFIVSAFLGVGAKHSKHLQKLASPVVVKFLHNVVGLAGYVIGIVSLCYAYYSNWFVFYTSTESRAVALFATILGALWTLNGSLVSGYNQIKSLLKR